MYTGRIRSGFSDPVDTSLREAAKELNRRQMLAELGQAASGARGRLELRPAPTVDDFRAAEGILHDPQLRLIRGPVNLIPPCRQYRPGI
jgi:hypothetical protein